MSKTLFGDDADASVCGEHERGLKYQKQSKTSKAAAIAALTGCGTLRDQVHAAISDAGSTGLTDEELATMMGRPQNSVRPRRIELVQATPAKVADSGRTRKTASGCEATVWVDASFVTDGSVP